MRKLAYADEPAKRLLDLKDMELLPRIHFRDSHSLACHTRIISNPACQIYADFLWVRYKKRYWIVAPRGINLVLIGHQYLPSINRFVAHDVLFFHPTNQGASIFLFLLWYIHFIQPSLFFHSVILKTSVYSRWDMVGTRCTSIFLMNFNETQAPSGVFAELARAQVCAEGKQKTMRVTRLLIKSTCSLSFSFRSPSFSTRVVCSLQRN